jgi:hypothetical protein
VAGAVGVFSFGTTNQAKLHKNFTSQNQAKTNPQQKFHKNFTKISQVKD